MPVVVRPRDYDEAFYADMMAPAMTALDMTAPGGAPALTGAGAGVGAMAETDAERLQREIDELVSAVSTAAGWVRIAIQGGRIGAEYNRCNFPDYCRGQTRVDTASTMRYCCGAYRHHMLAVAVFRWDPCFHCVCPGSPSPFWRGFWGSPYSPLAPRRRQRRPLRPKPICPRPWLRRLMQAEVVSRPRQLNPVCP